MSKEEIKYYAQSGQDEWVLEFLNNKTGGFFVDVGAYDGIQTSNTYTLEKFFNWNGICVEPTIQFYEKLRSNRECDCRNVALRSYSGNCQLNDQVVKKDATEGETRCITFNDLFSGVRTKIDYLSLDVEGLELEILESIDYGLCDINLMTIEHNSYLLGQEYKNEIFKFLSSIGYERVVNDAPCLDPYPTCYMKPYEDWYAKIK
jgi:FkbM family methyltransferase